MTDQLRARGGTAGLSLARLVAARLRKQAEPGFLMFEFYDADGEIEEASECWPLTEEHLAADGVRRVAILSPDEQGHHAEPKTDWQKRGVIPPRGFHRYRDKCAR